MKVPPKRKGNLISPIKRASLSGPSMKVPPKRKGNIQPMTTLRQRVLAPSMKVPPKRKGNCAVVGAPVMSTALNESPSEKEGK